MKNKKILSLALLSSLVLGGTSTFAETQIDNSGTDVQVQYDNTNTVVEPGADPTYLVVFPGNITFTDEIKVIDMSVKLSAFNSEVLPNDLDLDIYVESEHDYNLIHEINLQGEEEEDQLKYRLYNAEGNNVSQENSLVEGLGDYLGNFTTAASEIDAQKIMKSDAKLGADVAHYQGKYLDKLTYTVVDNNQEIK